MEEEFRVVINRNAGNGISPYRLIDVAGIEIKEVNEYLDSLATRGLSERTIHIYAYDLLNFWKWLNQVIIKLEDITKKSLLYYIRYQQQQESPAATTINHRLVVVGSLYRYHFNRYIPVKHFLVKEVTSLSNQYRPYRIGWLHPIRTKQITTRVKVPYHIVVPLTHQEVSQFFSSLKAWRDIAITGFMLFCGLRSREVMSLKLDDIRITEDQVYVNGKGNRGRVVPFPKDLAMTLNKYLRLERPKESSEYLFVVLKGQNRGKPLTPSGIRKIFRYHRRKSGVFKANPHRFRHTFGADMAKAGISLPVLMKLMGHTYVQTTMLYVNISAQDIREEFHKIVNKLHTREILSEPEARF